MERRRRVLDETKKREIVAILSVGCGRRTAARYVGCARSTIFREIQRDEHFAGEVRRAAQLAEINYLKNIQNAAKQEKYWRAAAWALERCNPDQYAARRADCLTLDEVRELLREFAQIVVEEVPLLKSRKAVLRRLDSLMRGLSLLKTSKTKNRRSADDHQG